MVNKEAALDAVFTALADPTRRALLAHLAAGATAVSDLAEPHDMSLPAVMKHLGVLERAGLVSRDKQGRTVTCRLEAAPMREADEWLNRYQHFWRGRLDRLAQYLDSAEENPPCPPSSNPRKRPSSSPATTRTRAKKSSARGRMRRR